MNSKQHTSNRHPVCGSTAGYGVVNAAVNDSGLKPVFVKNDGGDTAVYIPFDDAVQYMLVAAGSAEGLLNLSKLLAAASRFAAGDEGPDLKLV